MKAVYNEVTIGICSKCGRGAEKSMWERQAQLKLLTQIERKIRKSVWLNWDSSDIKDDLLTYLKKKKTTLRVDTRK